ncbi:MAG: WhiB family transcriptional regulator [bacterium]|nr:WhiB family transcriptional regulator [bacterium]
MQDGTYQPRSYELGAYTHPIPDLGSKLLQAERTRDFRRVETNLHSLLEKGLFVEMVDVVDWLGTSPHNFEYPITSAALYRLGMSEVIKRDSEDYKIESKQKLAAKFRLTLNAMNLTISGFTDYLVEKAGIPNLSGAVYERYVPFKQMLEVESFQGISLSDEPLCDGYGDVWFPPKFLNSQMEQRFFQAAVTVCTLCVHQKDCLKEATQRKEVNGVWGGVVFEETYRRKRKKLL